jgi:hypothetical protein
MDMNFCKKTSGMLHRLCAVRLHGALATIHLEKKCAMKYRFDCSAYDKIQLDTIHLNNGHFVPQYLIYF